LPWWQRVVDARYGFIRLQVCLEAGSIVLCLKEALQADKSASGGANKAKKPMAAQECFFSLYAMAIRDELNI
jgi:hypothetical protein